MIRKRVWMWAWGILILGRAYAQDLTWTELELNTEPPQPAAEVKMSGRHVPSVPAEIKKLSEIAYAEVNFVTDSKGKGMSRSPLATNPWLLRAVNEGLEDYRIKPVERSEGTSSYNETRCYLIFNPESAEPRKPNSTPRALVVRAAIFPTEVLAKDRKKRAAQELPVGVFADVIVNDAGAVTQVLPIGLDQPELAAAVITAVQQWQFAPARLDGSPISTTIHVPVLFTWPTLFNVSDLTKPPRAIKQTTPIYPFSERRGGFRGEVTVEFVVTTTGEVRSPFVYQSNNPNFNQPALDAVQQWKFEPGTVGNRPVNARMRVPMIFQLDGIENSDRYEVSQKKSPNLPERLQNDYPPRVKNVALGVYPFEELQKEGRATVTVNFLVRPDGRVAFTPDKGRTLSDFDRAARAMIEEFDFIPASKSGKPNWGMLKMEVKFDLGNEQVPVSSSARHILRELRKKEPAIFLANQLDRKIEPVVSHPPKFPISLTETGGKGEALIEFFIDEEGLVQLPRIVSATDPALGYAGVQAVSQWRFKPPSHNGKPVIVRARMPLVFRPEASSSETDGSASSSKSDSSDKP